MKIQLQRKALEFLHYIAATLVKWPALIFFVAGYLYGFYCMCAGCHMTKAEIAEHEQLVGWYAVWTLAFLTVTAVFAGWAIYHITQLTAADFRNYLRRKIEGYRE